MTKEELRKYGLYKLSTFKLNVVREGINKQGIFRIETLLDDEDLKALESNETYNNIELPRYTWAALKEKLKEYVRFDEIADHVFADEAQWARFDPMNADRPLEIKDQETWERLLKAALDIDPRRGAYTYIHLLIKDWGYDEFTEEEKARHWEIVQSQDREVDESDLTVPYESANESEPSSPVPASPIVHAVEYRRRSDVSESDLTEPWVEPSESEASGSEAKGKKKAGLAFRLGGRTARRTGRGAPRDASQVSLMDDKTEYETENAQDDDYGALDLTVIDNYIGSYNAGEKDWVDILEFLNMNLEQWKREEDRKNQNGDRKRVALKAIPGMSVSLFDYQFVAVYKFLNFLLHDVSGGFLCDEQGLGKTQDMFGLIAIAHNLRKSKAEVRQAWKSNNTKVHNAKDAVDARKCSADTRWGFRCYCYHALTRKIADLLPEGPNIIVAPERGWAQIYEEANKKLDKQTFNVRLDPNLPATEGSKQLSNAEIKNLTGSITATQVGDEVQYTSKAKTGQSDWIIICSPSGLNKLVSSFSISVKLPDGSSKKKSGLLPGMVLMDEFHEYTTPTDGSTDTPTIAWLKRQKESRKLAPLVYFASGTPFGESPADIRPAIDLFVRPVWNEKGNHYMNGASLEVFDELIEKYHKGVQAQNNGEILDPEVISDYRTTLTQFLKGTMVRRLGIDKFLERNLTSIGPLKVQFKDHPAPQPLIQDLQDLSDETRDLMEEELKEHPGKSIGIFLRSERGESLLLKLRLASTFPGISTPLDDGSFDFTIPEIKSFLSKAEKGDLTKTPYFQHIPTWALHSPKLDTITKTINTMMNDTSLVPGESSNVKKLILFSPIEAESMLLYGYLLLKKKKNNKIKPTWINSAMEQTTRQDVIKNFLKLNHSAPNVLVAPMSLAGTGLNLQKAKYSIVTSPAWTKRDNQQAYYRTHRVGQVQETQLSLLTAKWNPAERVILKKYEGGEVTGEDIWTVGGDHGNLEAGLVDKHQSAATTPISDED